MRFTILGAGGVIGSRLVKSLRDSGQEVFAPTRDDARVFSEPLGHVIYAIGLTADFRQRPFDTVEAHVSLLSSVLQRSNFDSLLYLSSTRVYAGAQSSSEDAMLMVDPANPSDLYNLSKLMGEALCHASNKAAVRIARLSNVVGGDDAGSDNFLPSLIREARSGRLMLRSALSSAKDYVHIDDVTGLLLRIAQTGRAAVYNVASGHQTSHDDWARCLIEQTGCSLEVAEGAPEQGFIPIDITRIRKEFGFEPRPMMNLIAEQIVASGSKP